MRLFRDMLHSIKSTIFRMYIIISLFTKWLRGPDLARITPPRQGTEPVKVTVL